MSRSYAPHRRADDPSVVSDDLKMGGAPSTLRNSKRRSIAAPAAVAVLSLAALSPVAVHFLRNNSPDQSPTPRDVDTGNAGTTSPAPAGLSTGRPAAGLDTVGAVLSGVGAWLNVDPQHGLREADFDGRATVVYFWGTYCPPCMPKIPLLNEFGDDPRIAVLAITNERIGPVRKFATGDSKSTSAFSVFVGVEAGPLFKAAGLSRVPYAVVFNPDNSVAFKDYVVDKEAFRNVIVTAASKSKGITSTIPRSPKGEWSASGAPLTAPTAPPPRPLSVAAFSLSEWEKFTGALRTKLSGTTENVAETDIERLGEFFSGNLASGGWPGDPEVRREVFRVWGGLYQRANSSDGSALPTISIDRNTPAPKAEDPKAEDPKAEDPKAEDPKAEDPKTLLRALAIKWIDRSNQTHELDPKARADFCYLLADLIPSESQQVREDFARQLRALLEPTSVDPSPEGRVALERLLYFTEHGYPEAPTSALTNPAFFVDIPKHSARHMEEQLIAELERSPCSIPLIVRVFEHAKTLPLVGRAGVLDPEALYRAGFAVGFVERATNNGEKTLPREQLRSVQCHLVDLFASCGGNDWLFDHRLLLRLSEVGVAELDSPAKARLREQLELSMKKIIDVRYELWWSSRRIVLMLDKSSD